MSPEALTALDAEVFTVGNYYNNGVGHISVDYGKVLSKGFKGIIEEAQQAKAEADRSLPDYIKKEQFLNAVIISAEAAIQFGKRFAEPGQESGRSLQRRCPPAGTAADCPQL